MPAAGSQTTNHDARLLVVNWFADPSARRGKQEQIVNFLVFSSSQYSVNIH